MDATIDNTLKTIQGSQHIAQTLQEQKDNTQALADPTSQANNPNTAAEYNVQGVQDASDTIKEPSIDPSEQSLQSTLENTSNSSEITPPPQLQESTSLNPEKPTKKSLDDFLVELAAAIEKNESVLANTHFSLQAIAQVLEISKELWEFYGYHVSSLKLNNDQYNQLKASLDTVANYINTTLLQISNTHKNALNLFAQTEALLDEAKSAHTGINTDLSTTKETLEKIKNIELSLQKIAQLKNELNALISTSEAVKKQITALSDNILRTHQVQLQADKEKFEREIENKKEESLALFNQKIDILIEKIEAFDIDFIEKERVINAANEKIAAFISEFENYKNELENKKEEGLESLGIAQSQGVQELENAKNAHLTTLEIASEKLQKDLQGFSLVKKDELQDFSNEKNAEIAKFKEEKASDLINENSNHLQELKITKDQFLQEINNQQIGQFLELRWLFFNIADSQRVLGSQYESRTFTSSGTFNHAPNVSDYFVFVRGGTGGGWSNASGGISSFGSYLSAAGGGGNSSGHGQRGEAKSAIVRVNGQSTNVTVSSGGVVIISYANKQVAQVDRSFITKRDLEILSNSQNGAEQNKWLQDNITDRASENYYRNMVGLVINISPLSESDISKIVNISGDPRFHSKRELELYAAKEFLDNNTPIVQTMKAFYDSLQEQASKEELEIETNTQDTPLQEPSKEQNSTENALADSAEQAQEKNTEVKKN